MSIKRRSFVPRKRRKIRWRIVAPLCLLAVLLFYTAFVFFFPKKTVEPIIPFSVCDLSASKTQALLHDRVIDETITMGDFLAYGETLNLYQDVYSIYEADAYTGKTMKLYDLCNIDPETDLPEYTFLLEDTVDGQIPMESLKPGFYEVYVTQDLVERRLVSTEKIMSTFENVRRSSGLGNVVTIMADTRLVNTADDQPALMDKNYVFLNVKETEIAESIADIYIDAGHRSTNGSSIDVGRSANGLVEAEETYKMAVLLKAEFEKYGLKVVLAREDDETVIDSYGVGGRLNKAYSSKAKYYIEVQLNGNSNATLRGSRVYYSSFSSNRLATTVFKSLMEITGFVPSSQSTSGNIKGVYASSRDKGLDARPTIRESGGRILAAGTYSDLSREGNASFAAEASLGLQTLTLEYGYITNAADANFWKQNMQQLAQKTVAGFVKHLQLEPVSTP